MIQPTDREDFKDKLAHLMAANVNLISAGAPADADLASHLIDTFLNQFEDDTPDAETVTLLNLPVFSVERGGIRYDKIPEAPQKAVGYVVVVKDKWTIPYDFSKTLFPTAEEAQESMEGFERLRPYNAGGYEVKGVYL